MKLFESFTQAAPNKVFASILFGALSGISYALLIPLVLTSIERSDGQLEADISEPYTFLTFEVANHQFAGLFLLTCVFILFSRAFSQITMTRVSMDVTSALRMRLYERISGAPIASLERLGSSKLIAILTTDVPRIIAGAAVIPLLLVSLVTVFGMLGFLLYLNSEVFWFVLFVIAFGMISYMIPSNMGKKYLIKARYEFDHLQESIRGLIHGAKELKVNNAKREAFFADKLHSHEQGVLNANKSGYTFIQASATYGDLISFFVIGAVAFIFVNYHSISAEELIGTIMALLYITSPIAMILQSVPLIFMSKVSLGQVNRVLADMPTEEAGDQALVNNDWQHIRFDKVCYHYTNADGSPGFQVGPVDLTINKGEVTFIVGGNGSGKSTLSKMVTLHYVPESGGIYFGDEAITAENLNSARQHIGSIYSDYYLFEQLHGVQGEGVQEQVDGYLQDLGLAEKVTFKDGKFSTLSLSDGQKRRLALVVAYMEDKDLYLFDEWAADQDPTFKEIFYHKILPGLKARGKAVVVISHDDRYFDVADQLIVMEEGKVAQRD